MKLDEADLTDDPEPTAVIALQGRIRELQSQLIAALRANAELAPLAIEQLVNEQTIAILRKELHDARNQIPPRA